ncbi:hypothetical protein OI75_15135, partial [Listeria monocytogenes]
AILPTLGGQTGLNMSMELSAAGLLAECNLEVLGTALPAIKTAEDREPFPDLMTDLGEPVPATHIIHNLYEAYAFVERLRYPVIVRPAYRLGGSGGGICNNGVALIHTGSSGLQLSPVTQGSLEQCTAGHT